MQLEPPNEFVGVMANRYSEREFASWLTKHGEPTFLQDELLQIGQSLFVPYVNQDCENSNCIYDLETLEDLYVFNGYNLEDQFERASSFSCNYCDKKVFFVGFFSSQGLADRVDRLFEEAEARKQERELLLLQQRRKSILSPKMKKLSNKGSQEYDASVTREPVKQQKKKLLIPLLSSQQRKPRSKQTFKLMAVSLANEELKEGLKSIRVPSLDEYDADIAQKARRSAQTVIREFKFKGSYSPFEPAEFSDFLFQGSTNIRPTFEQALKAIGAEDNRTPAIYETLLKYWRARVCQDFNKFLNLWVVEVLGDLQDLSNCQLKLRDDPNLPVSQVAESIETPFLGLLIISGSKTILLEYSRRTSSLALLTYVSGSKIPRSGYEAQPISLGSFFEKFNSQYLSSKLILKHLNIPVVELLPSLGSELSAYVMERFYDGERMVTLPEAGLFESWVLCHLGLLAYHPDLPQEQPNVMIQPPKVSNESQPYNQTSDFLGTIEEISMDQLSKAAKPQPKSLVTITKPTIFELPLSNDKPLNTPNWASSMRPALAAAKAQPISLRFSNMETLDELKIKDVRVRLPPKIDATPRNISGSNLFQAPLSPSLKMKTLLKSPKVESPRRVQIRKSSRVSNQVIENPDAKVTSGQLQEVKDLIEFYSKHDKQRMQLLISRCEFEFGASLKNLTPVPKSKRALNMSLLLTPQMSQAALNPALSFHRRGFSDYLPQLPTTPRQPSPSPPPLKSSRLSPTQTPKPVILSTALILSALSSRSKAPTRNISPTYEPAGRHRSSDLSTDTNKSLPPERLHTLALGLLHNERQALAHSFKTPEGAADLVILWPVRVGRGDKSGRGIAALLDKDDIERFLSAARVIIPFFSSLQENLRYSLVVLDHPKNLISVFDPMVHKSSEVKSGLRFEIQYVNSLVQTYPRNSLGLSELSLGRPFQPEVREHFAVIDEPSPQTREVKDSGFWVLYFVKLVVARTKRNPVFSSTVLDEFKLKLELPLLA